LREREREEDIERKRERGKRLREKDIRRKRDRGE
jgi:hypothetical protein